MRRLALLACTQVRATTRRGGRSKKRTAGTPTALAGRWGAAGTGARGAMSPADREAAGRQVPRAIVGLGSSAGGLDALRRFFNSMPSDSPMRFLVGQHLSPPH